MTKRQQQKIETKQKILEVAYRVYSNKGFTATTNDIAKEAGVSHGTVFTHFPTLVDLLIYVLEDFEKAIAMRLHAVSRKSRSMEMLLEAHIEVLEEYEDFYIRLLSERHLLPEQAVHTVISLQSIVSLHFLTILEKDIVENKTKDLKPYMIFNIWIGILHYYLQNHDLFSPNVSVLRSHKKVLINVFLELIKK